MSTYYVVHLRTATAPETLADAHAADAVFLNSRGRPCTAARAAWLESEGLATALREACQQPLALRHEGVALALRKVDDATADAARIAADSNATREWLEAQTVV